MTKAYLAIFNFVLSSATLVAVAQEPQSSCLGEECEAVRAMVPGDEEAAGLEMLQVHSSKKLADAKDSTSSSIAGPKEQYKECLKCSLKYRKSSFGFCAATLQCKEDAPKVAKKCPAGGATTVKECKSILAGIVPKKPSGPTGGPLMKPLTKPLGKGPPGPLMKPLTKSLGPVQAPPAAIMRKVCYKCASKYLGSFGFCGTTMECKENNFAVARKCPGGNGAKSAKECAALDPAPTPAPLGKGPPGPLMKPLTKPLGPAPGPAPGASSAKYEWFHADCPKKNIRGVNGDDPAAQSMCTARAGCAGWSRDLKTGYRMLRSQSQECKKIATGKWIYFKKIVPKVAK